MNVTGWFQDFRTKLKWASAVFRTPSNQLPMVDLGGALLDLKSNVIRIEGDFHIHSTGPLRLSTDSDLILQSGKLMGQETGDLHLNPELNEFGVPLIQQYSVPEDQYGETDHEHNEDCEEKK